METRKNVLFINHSVRDGGPGKSLFYILKYLDRERVNPHVLIPADDVFSERLKEEGIYENIILDDRFPENLKKPRFKETGGLYKFLSVLLNITGMISLIFSSRSIVKKHGIDVIYCNGTQAKVVGAFMGLVSGRPVIWHVRNIQQTRLLWTIINLLALFASVKRIICVSGPTAAQFRYAREKLRVIHNGIDLDDYDPGATAGDIRSSYGIGEGTVIVGSTGRIVPRKGYDLFIKAAGVVLRELDGKAPDVKFVIVGDTPFFFSDNHMDYLKNLVAGMDLDDHIIFTGFRADVRPCLKDFDIFVIPSAYPDPFPRSVIEAMAFALPVVGFYAGGIVESVDDGATGLLNESGNAEKLGMSILKLVKDPALRERMGIAGRERVKKNLQASELTARIQENILEVA